MTSQLYAGALWWGKLKGSDSELERVGKKIGGLSTGLLTVGVAGTEAPTCLCLSKELQNSGADIAVTNQKTQWLPELCA